MLNVLRRPTQQSSGGFHPLQLGSLLKVWFDADSGVAANPGVATDWTDRVGGIVATSLLTVTPAYSATSFNGKAGFTFDGTDDCFVSTSFAACPTGANPCEMFVLIDDVNTGTGTSYSFTYGGVATATDRAMMTTGAGRFFRVNDRTTNLTAADQFAARQQVLSSAFYGTTETARIGGRLTKPGFATIATLATGTTRLRIGAAVNATAVSFLQGVIRHIIVTDLLTDPVRSKLEGWLAWDGGCPHSLHQNHPYRNYRP